MKSLYMIAPKLWRSTIVGLFAALSVQGSRAAAADLIRNGSFESGLAPWKFSVSGGAKASQNRDSSNRTAGLYGEAIHVQRAVTNCAYCVQLFQDGLALTSGKPVTVTYSAKASRNRQLEVGLQQSGGAWQWYKLTYQNITTTFATYSFTFTPTVSNSNVRLNFDMGNIAGDVFIDNVSVTIADSTSSTPAPAPAPAPAPEPSAFSILSPANNASVSGVIQVKGVAGSQWLNVAAYDVNNSNNKVGADFQPVNGSYTLSIDTANLVAVNGVVNISVMAFSVTAGQSGGTSASLALALQVAAPAPAPAPAPDPSAFSILSPANNASVSGVIQIKGVAGSQWVNVAAYDVNNSNNKVAADVQPVNGSYTLSIDTANLVAVNGVANISVTAFSVAAGQSGGTSASLALALQVSSSAPAPAPTPSPSPAPSSSANMAPPAGYSSAQLVFEDTFSQSSLDTSKWNSGIGTANQGPWVPKGVTYPNTGVNPGEYMLQYYSPSQISTGPGGLVLTAERDNSVSGFSWKSGGLYSGNKLTVPAAGGYVQFRAKLPDMTTGVWPAFWFLGPNSDNEFDLIDAGFTCTGGPNYCVSSKLFAGAQKMFQSNPGVLLAGQWVTYGVEFRAGKSIKTYINGILTSTITDSVPSTIQYELIISLQIASNNANGWHSLTSSSTPSPVRMYVNDVQIYKLP